MFSYSGRCSESLSSARTADVSAHGGPRRAALTASPPPMCGRPTVRRPWWLRRVARGAAAAQALAPASEGRDTGISSGRSKVSKYGLRPDAGKVGTWNRAVWDDFLRWMFFGQAVWNVRVGVYRKRSESKIRPGRSPTRQIRYAPVSCGAAVGRRAGESSPMALM